MEKTLGIGALVTLVILVSTYMLLTEHEGPLVERTVVVSPEPEQSVQPPVAAPAQVFDWPAFMESLPEIGDIVEIRVASKESLISDKSIVRIRTAIVAQFVRMTRPDNKTPKYVILLTNAYGCIMGVGYCEKPISLQFSAEDRVWHIRDWENPRATLTIVSKSPDTVGNFPQ